MSRIGMTPSQLAKSIAKLVAQREAGRPIGGLMDPRFVYVPANRTDIRATFARVRAAPLIPPPKKAEQ